MKGANIGHTCGWDKTEMEQEKDRHQPESRKKGSIPNLRVLHYMLGIPPVRGGGLVRYATDLMVLEQAMGQDVRLLIPGKIPYGKNRAVTICKGKTYHQIPAYEIFNPLPIPMGNGILAIDDYTRSCDVAVFERFLDRVRPDVIHIHSFMGLHREFLLAARKRKLPVLFTTHDYFGICPISTMLCKGHICQDKEWTACGRCCQNAYPRSRLRLEQSVLYRHYRKSAWLIDFAHNGKFRKCFRAIRAPAPAAVGEAGFCGKDYTKLREYYEAMFDLVTCFHFNSSLAKTVYEARIGEITGQKAGKIVPISHAGIGDHRKRHTYAHRLRIGYFGNWSAYKGFELLLDACRQLYEGECPDMELHVYSDTDIRKEAFVKNHRKFGAGQTQIEAAFADIDVLAVPSIWPETFGFVALEAASYGVPVILSKFVGAKDMLEGHPGIGFVYDGTLQGLKQCIRAIYRDRDLLRQANEKILEMESGFSYERHVEEMLGLYAAAP